ncbi:helix-turn-helix transcriptional regulator [Streptomyces griseosporeus]|uniref:helix-turn-helix transcriptional regulator n=1 Tax=Streptomyces griseosporeus TaxID=1910 RepID=UPI0037A42379
MTGRTTTERAAAPSYRPGPRGERIAALLDRLRTEGGAHLVTGEPGGGRTAFLDFAARSHEAAGPVIRVRSDASRAHEPYAGLSALCRAVVRAGGAGAASRPAAWGDPPGTAPLPGADPRTAGEALLTALQPAAGSLLVCLDDAHLWDAPSRAALGHAAARLHAAAGAPDLVGPGAGGGRVGLLVGVAGHRPVDREFTGLPVLRLDPLAPADAAALLDEVTGVPVDPAVRDALVAEAEGNPALLLALARRLSAAQLRGERPLPRPVADAETLTAAFGGHLTGLHPDHHALLLTVAAATRASGGRETDAAAVLRAVARLGLRDPRPWPDTVDAADGRLRMRSALLGRALYAAAPPEERREVHRALARSLPAHDRLLALLHRSWATTAPDPDLAAALTATASDPAVDAPPDLRRTAHLRAAALSADSALRAHSHTRAAEQALLGGHTAEAVRLLDSVRDHPAPAAVRGRAELLRGTALLRDGPVDDARASFLLAARLLTPGDPARAARATLAAADAAWAAGDAAGCLRILGEEGEAPDPYVATDLPAGPSAPHRPGPLDDYRTGMRAVLEARFDQAAAPLRRVLAHSAHADEPEHLLRSAAAALLLGDVAAARRAGARALAVARTLGSAALEPRALEYLAYAELRAGRHALARTHAEQGLREARRTGQRNTAAHHQAVLALTASIEGAPEHGGDGETAEEHAAAALATARRHGLAQAGTLAQWAAARADLGRGRPREAADRLGLLVRPGPRRGHFAVWMLAVPCYVEAAALAGHPEDARAVVDDFALWAACGADPHAPAQLLRCRALLAAAPDTADELYRQALDRHEDNASDYERARTELLYGKWLRRRRRLREARERLGAALIGFERSGARPWARQAAAELRANGASADGRPTGELSRLTPQQLRIARQVAQGATNREVALSLSVSTRTVDYHLRNVFAALGVRSRVELARMVEQAEKSGAQL